MRAEEASDDRALADIVRERLRLAETIADLELRLRRLTGLYATLALGLSVDVEAMAGIWASLGAHNVGLRRYPARGAEAPRLTLSLWVESQSCDPHHPDVQGQGTTIVAATRDAVGRLREWEQQRLAGFRGRAEELEESLVQHEVCFACAGPPGSCPTCTQQSKVAASAA